MIPTRVPVKWSCTDPLCDHLLCQEQVSYLQSDFHDTRVTIARRPNDIHWDWSVVVHYDGSSVSEKDAKKQAMAAARSLINSVGKMEAA